jgi:hypothetical protein
MSNDNIIIDINKYNNNIYELLYVSLDGKLNMVNKNVWMNSNVPFDVIGTNITSNIASNILLSKITQLNTGEFLFLGSNCNVYKMRQDFTNPTVVSSKKFSSLTQLSDYRILLTSKNGKMYIVDDINNFDTSTKEFFDDGTIYCMVKQTGDGYVVAIDGTQCGNAWRFELIDSKLVNKTKINLDDTFTNRVTVFLPDQQSLLNLNCNSRYKDRVYKYEYLDKTIKTKYDYRCDEDEEYEPFNKKCYKKCPTGYTSKPGDIVSCWGKCGEGDVDVGALCREGCRSGYHDVAGVCWNDKKITYDIGVGIPPSYSCPTGYELEGLRCIKDPPDGYKRLPGDYTTYWLKESTSYTKGSKPANLSCPTGYELEGLRCIKDPPDGYKRLPGDYTTYWLKESTSYTKGSKPANQDNSACDGLTTRTTGLGTCSGWDDCNSKTPVVCTKLCKSCTYDNYTWGCNADRCGREADVCAGDTCLPTTKCDPVGWDNCKSRTAKSCTKLFGKKTCVGGDCVGGPTGGECRTDPCGSRTPKTCSPGPAKCCNDGLKTTLTGINCDKCGTYDSCTGGTCVGAIVTRKAPRSCPTGYNFDSGDPLKIGLCYEDCRDGYESRPGDIVSCWNKKPTSITIPPSNTINANKSCPIGYKYDSGDPAKIGLCYEDCRDGYESRPGDIVSCWNKKPTSITIPPSNTINATPSCNSDREYRDLMCYKKCDPGYVSAATNCSLPISDQSYVPKTYSKKSISRGNPSNPGIPAPIECGDECCMFDLTFYNPAYIKPENIILPDIPITDGLVGFYNANSFGTQGVWYDLSSYKNNITQMVGKFTKNTNFITGDIQTSILFPTQILPAKFTMFNVAKYNYKSQTNMQENNIGNILGASNSSSNWFFGFNKGLSGVSARNQPITQTNLSTFDDKWVFSTDTNNMYRANGNNYTINDIGETMETNKSLQLSINLGKDKSTYSDYSIACIIVFNRILTDDEISSVEDWLGNTYADLLSQTYTKTFAELGYSCFDNKIGKVSNDYQNYILASYNNGSLDCKWLNLPEKKSFKPLKCNSTTNIQYENFINLDVFNMWDWDNFIMYLLVIIIIITLVCKKYCK